MNIPEGFVLVPVEPTDVMKDVALKWGTKKTEWEELLAAAPPVELPAYDEASELAACRANWEKNPNCLFSDMWLGWKACAQSRDGSVGE